MSIIEIYGIDCACPNCGNKPKFEYPSCTFRIRWANALGGGGFILCQKCETETYAQGINGIVAYQNSKPITHKIAHWEAAREAALAKTLRWIVVKVKNEQIIAPMAFSVRMDLKEGWGWPNKESFELVMQVYELAIHRIEKLDTHTISLILV